MDVLNVASTLIYTILALIVNFKRNGSKKMGVIAKISRYFERNVVTLKSRKAVYIYIDIQYITLAPDKILNSLI